MHRPRYYRNPAMYQTRGDPNAVRFGYNSAAQMARNTYRRASTTPFSPSHNRDPNLIGKHFSPKQLTYASPRFPDRSKYVWTANKQQSTTQAQPTQQPQPQQQIPQSAQPKIPTVKRPQVPQPQQLTQQQSKPTLIKKINPNSRDIGPLSVTILDTPEAVANDIASKLQEEKVYLISKVVSVLGVKKAIKLYYETRQKEINGGILVQNGIRRRTPGGVFLTLLRESSFISPIEVDRIFLEIKRHELKLKLTNLHDTS